MCIGSSVSSCGFQCEWLWVPVMIEHDLRLVGEYLVNSVAMVDEYWPQCQSWLGLQWRPCLPCYVDNQMGFEGSLTWVALKGSIVVWRWSWSEMGDGLTFVWMGGTWG